MNISNDAISTNFNMSQFRSVQIGIFFSLLTILYGFALGIAFGAAEGPIKTFMAAPAQEVFDSVYNGDEAAVKKVIKKSWVYLKRAHIHANGIGTTALALIILLSFLNTTDRIKKITASLLGVGALGYSSFWMFAALKGPGIGSARIAKESLFWLAGPSAFICILGVTVVLGIFVINLLGKKTS